MKNFITPHQNTIAQSLDYNTAQLALTTLQGAGFPPEQFSLVPEELDPNASMNETEAAKSAGMGATAGAVFGGLMGGLVAYGSSLTADFVFSPTHLIGLVLLGSGVGAAAVALLGAMSGASVHKGQDVSAPIQQYILIADVDSEQLHQAQAALAEKGIPITPN